MDVLDAWNLIMLRISLLSVKNDLAIINNEVCSLFCKLQRKDISI